jgi:hypothetical protein
MFGWVPTVLLLVAVLIVISFTPPLLGRRGQRTLTGPLGRVAGVYARFMMLSLAFGAFWIFRTPSRSGPVCVNTGYPPGTGGGAPQGLVATHGASLSVAGSIQACVAHPSLAQWSLYLLTRLPSLLLWACLLVLILRLIRQTERSGPFTPRAAATMRQLGWLVVGGSMIVAAMSATGTDLLTRVLMTPAPYDAKGIVINVLIYAPLKALFPVPALAGAALITFGRITGVGAVLDEELKATV